MSSFSSDLSYRVLIHGGAGVIPYNNPDGPTYKAHLHHILQQIRNFIHQTDKERTPIDIVEYAIQLLEDDELFNAGKGGVYANSGLHELEASMMDGKSLKCGAASFITEIRHPISVARVVMEKTPHNYLLGKEAEKLAIASGLEKVDNSFFDTKHRYEQFLAAQKVNAIELDEAYKRRHHTTTAEVTATNEHKTGTVGCVVFYKGNIAAGTSTGGLTNKMSGRVGDTPIIGAGTYADNRYAAVSCTGVGEEFMRYVIAYDIIARIQYGKVSLEEAVKGCFAERIPEDTGGLITLDAHGNYQMKFNTIGMFRGMIDSTSNQAKVGIWAEEENYPLV